MSRRPEPQSAARHRLRTLAGTVILLAVLGGLAAVASLAWVRGVPDRGLAVGLVSAVCGLASLGAWIVSRLGADDPALAVSRALGGTVVRLLPMLAFLGWLTDSPWSPPLAGRLREAGAGGLLVGFYLVMLATDILLHIMWGPAGGVRPRRAESSSALRRDPPSPADGDGPPGGG